MSELTLAPPAAAAAAPGSSRWGFWATGAWGLVVIVAFYGMQLVALIGVILWWGIDLRHTGAAIRAASSDATGVSVTTIACVPEIGRAHV